MDDANLSRQMSKREAAQMELKILTGCDGCGRRVIENDRPVPGAIILQRTTGIIRFILCKECQSKPELIEELYKRELKKEPDFYA